jgi:hypothetical protein
MATITVTVASLSKSKTISAADTTRVLEALKKHYGKVDDGAGGLRDRTNPEVFEIAADSFFGMLRDIVRMIEREAASKAVADAVADVVIMDAA